MVNRTLNNASGVATDGQTPDAHGQAAMLLVESLIHGLITNSVISVTDAVEIVRTAADVQQEIANDCKDAPASMEKSLTILGAICTSLSNDLPEKEVRPWPPRR
jgi:hypothetical protein